MVIIDKYNLIFIHIPKTGGTSIEFNFDFKLSSYNSKKFKYWGIENKKCMQHYLWNDYKELEPDKWKFYYKFSVVRDPYKKIISAYKWNPIFGRNKKKTFKEFLEKTNEIIENNEYSDNAYYDQIMPQYKFIFDENNNLMVDKVFKLETLNEKFNSFLDERGADIDKLVHINKTKKREEIILDKDDIKIINKLYKKDFELLGYKMKN
tara:strand:- start:2051 stop:2671 length:621 start_codon:yes stop_codon:yes gene_type:complete